MPQKITLLLLILFLFLVHSTLHALETESIRNEEVTVQYEKTLRTVAGEVVRIYPSVRGKLEETLKWKIDFRPSIFLVKDRETFRKIAGTGPVVAIAIPEEDLIIIDNSKMKTHPFTMEITLQHELCHLLLHRYIEDEGLPRWLNEGVSQWVSGGIAELIIGENNDLLKRAALSGRFIPIDYLTHKFPADPESLLMAYQESKSIVEYIIREFGEDGLLQLLNQLREGSGINNALQDVLAVTMHDLESKWHDYLRTKFTWFTYLSSHIYQLIFFLAALIMLYGFIVFLIRRRAYRDNDELI